MAPLASLLLFALLDLGCRLYAADLLGLHFAVSTLLASLGAALLGVGRDLALVAPAWLALAWVPGAATRALATGALGAALLILAADTVYFVQTFEHVEPVLFKNLNRSTVLGTLAGAGPVALAGLAGGVLAWGLLLGAHAAWLRRAATRPTRGRALALAALAALAPAALLGNHVRIAVTPRAEGIEPLLSETRNAYLEKVSAPVLGGFLAALGRSRALERPAAPPPPAAYAADERAVLADLGLLRDPAPAPADAPGFDRIVFVVLESLPAAYLHHENPRIPAEATPFLDELLRRHPHVDRFYTSNMPTDYGLNALFLSRLAPDWGGGRASLFSVLRREAGFESYFVRAVSKHYGDQLASYPRLFQMDHFLAYEELQARHGSKWHSAWGVNNGTVYTEGLRILEENRDRRLVLVLKTIDLHQPGPFQGIPKRDLPPALQRLDVPLFAALHWVDRCLQAFFADLEARGLQDERTLVVVTSDHAPHPGAAYRAAVPREAYERLGRLPLVFVTKNARALRDLDRTGLASQVDLAPTILALLGIPAPVEFTGRSLLGRDPGRFRLGLYRDAFLYASDRVAFAEPVGAAPAPGTPRNRAIRKWLRNRDARPPS